MDANEGQLGVWRLPDTVSAEDDFEVMEPVGIEGFPPLALSGDDNLTTARMQPDARQVDDSGSVEELPNGVSQIPIALPIGHTWQPTPFGGSGKHHFHFVLQCVPHHI